jgi:small subunit ribosomal protein S16
MLTIRLQRVGTKNKPAFRVVLAERERAVGKKFLEILGHYNPNSKVFGIKDEERLKYWLSQNVHLSPTMQNLLVTKNLLDKPKVKAWRPKKKEQAKTEAEAPSVVKKQAEAKAAESKAEEVLEIPEAKADVPKEPKANQEVKPAASDAEASLSPRSSESGAGAPKGREAKTEQVKTVETKSE